MDREPNQLSPGNAREGHPCSCERLNWPSCVQHTGHFCLGWVPALALPIVHYQSACTGRCKVGLAIGPPFIPLFSYSTIPFIAFAVPGNFGAPAVPGIHSVLQQCHDDDDDDAGDADDGDDEYVQAHDRVSNSAM